MNLAYIKPYIREHKCFVSIIVFALLLSIVHFTKPAIVYREDGGFREFGVGYRQNTVVSIWVVTIVLAILSYIAVLTALTYMRGG